MVRLTWQPAAGEGQARGRQRAESPAGGGRETRTQRAAGGFRGIPESPSRVPAGAGITKSQARTPAVGEEFIPGLL